MWMIPGLRSDYVIVTSYPLFDIKTKTEHFVDFPPSSHDTLITVNFKTCVLKFLWIGVKTAAWLTNF